MRRVIRAPVSVPAPVVLCAVLLIAVLGGAAAASAEPRPLAAEPSAAGEAYLKAMSGRRVSTDVTYYDPAREAPPLETRGKAPDLTEPRDDGPDTAVEIQWAVVAIAAVLLAGVIALAVRFGGTTSVSFSRQPDQRRRRAGSASQSTVPDIARSAGNETLADIARMTDLRAAIVTLGSAAVRRAAEANGLGVGRSWTMRDVLRRLPQGWPHLPALRAIARAAEITHFGGRDIDALELHAHIEAARPIFGENPA